MVRKPAYAVYLSCLVVILCLGTSFDTLGQLSDFGLPKQQTEAPQTGYRPWGVIHRQSATREYIPDCYCDGVCRNLARERKSRGRRTSHTDSSHPVRCARSHVW